ncbi:MAG: M56 family metallopeptidase [Defluviitaleaceae bacterium]|nr:M56 family metallopeptidase [Defluviitaleaceae bacterium]
MDNLFLTVLNMSLTGAFVIAAICIARLPFKKAPKIISYCLWAVAGFRLVFPFSIESILSLIPFNAAPIPTDIAMQPVPRIDSGIPFMNNAVSGVLPAPMVGDSVNPLQVWTAIGAYAWIVGVVIMVLYGVVSYFILKQKMRGAVHIETNIYEADNIKSPFVLGVFNPKIYMPIGLSAQERGYILLHEQTHVKRRDHIVKFGAYFILCLHWFNPLAWVAFLLMGVDMELSCDERVLKETGDGVQKDYSRSLLALATERRIIGGSPLAFGEGGVKQRIKNVLNFRKPSRVIILASVILASVLSVGLALNRTPAISLENDNLYGMKIVYEENPAAFLSDMKLIWDNVVYHVTPMTGVQRGNRIGIADDEYSTWLVYELRGHDRDFLFIAESRNEDVWRIMSSHPPESPLQQYILENATDRQRMERLLSVTLFLDGTAILATPPISSFMMRQPNFYTFTDNELLIHYENGDMVARFEILNDSDMIYERTLVFIESSVPLFADVGARYAARFTASAEIPVPVDDTITIYMFKDGSGQVGFLLFNWELTFDPAVLSSSNGYIDVAGLNAALAKYPQDTIRRVFVKHTSDFTKDEVITITDQFVIPSGNFNMGTGLAEWDGTM